MIMYDLKDISCLFSSVNKDIRVYAFADVMSFFLPDVISPDAIYGSIFPKAIGLLPFEDRSDVLGMATSRVKDLYSQCSPYFIIKERKVESRECHWAVNLTTAQLRHVFSFAEACYDISRGKGPIPYRGIVEKRHLFPEPDSPPKKTLKSLLSNISRSHHKAFIESLKVPSRFDLRASNPDYHSDSPVRHFHHYAKRNLASSKY